LNISQIWHVEVARSASGRADGDRHCYQIIARLVRERKNYWVAVDTRAVPPMRTSFVVFDDYGLEVEPGKSGELSIEHAAQRIKKLHQQRQELLNKQQALYRKRSSGGAITAIPTARMDAYIERCVVA
jgi:hypothetical protein